MTAENTNRPAALEKRERRTWSLEKKKKKGRKDLVQKRQAASNESRFILSSFSYQTSHLGWWTSRKWDKERRKKNQRHRERLVGLTAAWLYGARNSPDVSAFKIPIKDKSVNTFALLSRCNCPCRSFSLPGGMNDASLMHLTQVRLEKNSRNDETKQRPLSTYVISPRIVAEPKCPRVGTRIHKVAPVGTAIRFQVKVFEL